MQISDAEWQVMKIIWMQGEQTSTDLIKVLAERFDWSKSTIQTLLARLVEKECLTRKKEGKSFVYSALLTLDQSQDLLLQFQSYHSPILQSSCRASYSCHKRKQILQPAQA